MRIVLTYLFLLTSLLSAGQVDLAVQKAHADEIIQLQFSNSGKYLVSMGANSEFVIWDMFHEKSISSFSLSSIEQIQGMKFSADETELEIATARATYFYNIANESFRQEKISNFIYRQKDFYYDERDYETNIKKGVIQKRNLTKKRPRYKLAVSYDKTPFTAFAVSEESNLVVAVTGKERIFIYDYQTGSKVKELTGHVSGVNDACFTADGKLFATAGRDRSIIIWNAETFTIKTRLASNVYRKTTAEFSHDGQHIFVGDELGYIYDIDFHNAFPQIRVSRPNFHAVNKIRRVNTAQFLLGTSHNSVELKNEPLTESSEKKFKYRDHAFLESKALLLQKAFNTYQQPFGEVDLLDVSPNAKHIIYSGKAEFPCIAFSNLESGGVKRMYNYYDNTPWKDIGFVANDVFIGIQDSSDILYFWKITEKEIQLKTDTLSFVLDGFEFIGDQKIWLNTKHYGQYIYDFKTRIPEKIMSQSALQVFKRGNFMVLESNSHALIFYDLNKKETYYQFIGHKEEVTDVNFHPEGDKFVSSSNDGTVRLWSISQKRTLATIIPFKNQEFVFITEENYYLMTKGALDEIGFKVKEKYYYPEQFDLKFNRPDIVLERMGFTGPNLITAYRKAYQKRLKKMRFTESQIRGDFHLPESEIINRKDIANSTVADSILLDVQFFDDKFKLDRINVWINDVAIYGIEGLDVRNLDRNKIEEKIWLKLGDGSNKIEVSVLNQTGAESYKSTLQVEKTGKKERPNLFIASIGISKHEDSRYDLTYADKDARDLVSQFKESDYFESVEAMTLTNQEVTRENLPQLKTFLSKAKINDVVLVFIAGHGVLNDDFDYFFATHDMDFDNPDENGAPYESIENLLDGIAALKKLLIMDTCHSGELDKEEVEENEDKEEQGDLIFRNVGKSVKLKDNPLGLQSTNDLMKSLFTDLRRGTGATVISSSGGTELSIEGNNYKNGLFTYCLLQGLASGEADLNGDKKVFVSELQQYVRAEVNRLSNGLQTPTSRIQNKELDYRIW